MRIAMHKRMKTEQADDIGTVMRGDGSVAQKKQGHLDVRVKYLQVRSCDNVIVFEIKDP